MHHPNMRTRLGNPVSWHLAALCLVVVPSGTTALAAGGGVPTAADYSTIQAALDANPGAVVFVPAGEHHVTNTITIARDGAGLCGPGRLIQHNPDAPVIRAHNARDIRVEGLTLTRAPGTEDARAAGLQADDAPGLCLDGIRVLDNRAAAGAIRIERCNRAEVRHCHVLNYSTISIDDRTGSADWGYAFNCIDGSGIVLRESKGALLQANSIIETNLRPTREFQQRHKLGEFVKRSPVKGSLLSQKVWDEGRVNNWHQGSAIVVTSPETTDLVRILDNHIENAAQGIDIHADHVIVSGNIVANAFMGMKAMHGSRHVLIANNQFSGVSLWAIGLMPGAASHAAMPAAGDSPARGANIDGGSIIANNIISDFGRGDAWWIWSGGSGTRAAIRLDDGQKPDNPPLSDVIVTGNVVSEGSPGSALQPEPPRYQYALLVGRAPNGPRGLRVFGNIFHPGSEGVCNIELPP